MKGAKKLAVKYVSQRLSLTYFWQTFHVNWLSIYLEYKC